MRLVFLKNHCMPYGQDLSEMFQIPLANILQKISLVTHLLTFLLNYRPQILLLSGFPADRPALVDFANAFTRGIGLLICGHSLNSPINQRVRNNLTQQSTEWLFARKVKAFYALSDESTSICTNLRSLMQSVGFGKLRPNLVLMGFKSDWHSCESHELLEYFNIIQYVFPFIPRILFG